MIEPPPEPRQLLPIEEDHEVAAKREERAVSEAQTPGIPPDQIEAQRQQRVAQVLAQQRHQVIGQRDRRVRRHPKIEEWHGQNEYRPAGGKARPKGRAPRVLVLAAAKRRHGLPLSLCCAALERKETARPALDE